MNSINILIEVTGTWCNCWPNFQVKINNQIYVNQPIEGQQILKFCADIQESNTITLMHYGKNFGTDGVWDTQTKDNLIVQDRAVKLTRIELDGVDIAKYISRWPFQTDIGETYYTDYFGHNGQLIIKFSSPVYKWIITELVCKTVGPDTAQDLILETSHSSVFDYAQDLIELEEIEKLLVEHAHLLNKSS